MSLSCCVLTSNYSSPVFLHLSFILSLPLISVSATPSLPLTHFMSPFVAISHSPLFTSFLICFFFSSFESWPIFMFLPFPPHVLFIHSSHLTHFLFCFFAVATPFLDADVPCPLFCVPFLFSSISVFDPSTFSSLLLFLSSFHTPPFHFLLFHLHVPCIFLPITPPFPVPFVSLFSSVLFFSFLPYSLSHTDPSSHLSHPSPFCLSFPSLPFFFSSHVCLPSFLLSIFL